MEATVFNLPMILSIIAVLIGLIAIILVVIQNLRIKRYQYDGELRNYIVETVLKSSRIQQEYKRKEQVNIPTPAKTELSTEEFNFIVETVISTVQDDLAKKEASSNRVKTSVDSQDSEQQVQESDSTVKAKPTYKFASSYDLKKKTFYKVEDRASDETIYELAINAETGASGVFTVYKHAYKKVTECRDFLEGACEVSGAGVNIQIEKEGIISLSDGKWIVEQPIVLKFI